MSERKVLNKYYPPDFDPTKLIKLKLPKQRQYTVRIMTPFNMRCNTCGDYIAKAKKFNARKETIENQAYLDLKIFRFYIKCPKCMSEITFKTNPETCDYEMEFGAQRSFDALRLAELQEKAEIDKEKEEEKLNPMKLLENRTKQSREEMEELERLQQIKEENANKEGLNVENLFDEAKNNLNEKLLAEEKLRKEEEEDNLMVKKLLKEAELSKIKNQKNDTVNSEIHKSLTKSDNSNDTKNEKKRKIESLITLKKKKPVVVEEKPKLSSLCNYDSDSSD